MKHPLRLEGWRGAAAVALPQDLDAIAIKTSIGVIHLDLTAPIADMVLLSTAGQAEDGAEVRLILSPMASGRLAVGVIHYQ